MLMPLAISSCTQEPDHLTALRSAEEHGGTHFDAPLHFAEGGLSVDKIPVERLTGEGIVVDVKEKVAANRDYLIGIDDFKVWESRNGRIPDDAIVLVNTGFARFYPDAARWLTTDRKIKAFGLDTPSIHFGQSKDFMTHRVLFAAGITAYENLAHLDRLPPGGFWVIALPMMIRNGSGAPLRIVAVAP